jgi:hypothetical protein
LVVLEYLRRRWSLSGREGFWVLSPSRRACEAGFRRFCGGETLIFHCTEGWNRRRSHEGDHRCFPSDRRWLRRRQTQLSRLVLCPRWRALFSVRQTLVSGATDVDISVCWLTLVRALLKEAMDAVVLKRWARLMWLHAVWELTGLRPSSDGCTASVATNASVGWNRPLEF